MNCELHTLFFMRIKRCLYSITILVFVTVAIGIVNYLPNFYAIKNLPDNIVVSTSELGDFDKAISCSFKPSIDTDCESTGTLNFRFFGLIPIKSVKARVENDRQVYLGGQSVGLAVKSDGIIVERIGEVDTKVGKVVPNSQIQVNDIITEFNGKRILHTQDLLECLNSFSMDDAYAEILVIRDGKEKRLNAYPVIEQYSESYRLGLEVKEYLEGIGTVTYVKKCGEFASLGHPINSVDGKLVIPCFGGNVYDCKIVGHIKGKKGKAGELKGYFTNVASPSGQTTLNSRFGVYGKFNDTPQGLQPIDISSRLTVKPGKAKMVTTIGEKTEQYDIEIIKASSQSLPQEKGLVFKVTDKRLLNTTGGIVQGMSGSPIIQNGKLVGAVTHVFINDPTKGYGVYLDWVYK